MLGQNPRLLGSGHHENAFFQDFFTALLDNGCWNGQILNRTKSGRIYLTWQSIKLVEDEHGKVISYIAAVVDLSVKERKIIRLARKAGAAMKDAKKASIRASLEASGDVGDSTHAL